MSFISDIKQSPTAVTIRNVVKKTYGPLAKLEFHPEESNGIYRYPMEVGDSQIYPHTVEFQAWIPKPKPMAAETLRNRLPELIAKSSVPDGNTTPNSGKTNYLRDFGDDNINRTQYWNRDVEQLRINKNRQYNSRMTDWNRDAVPSDLLVMYLPAGSWNDQVMNQYAEISVAAALGNLGLGLDAASTFKKAMDSTNGSTTDKIIAGATAVSNSPAGVEAIMRVLGGFAQGAGIVGDAGQLTDLTLQSLGYAVNPQMEMLYGGTQMREFQFDFTMTPRNAREGGEITHIVNRFKFHASPDMTTDQGRYLIPPSIFDITLAYKNIQNPYLPKISTCALRSMDVNYSGGLDTFASFADGRPIQTQMILRFVELEMMHKTLRMDGY